jgi:hypothetical protein
MITVRHIAMPFTVEVVVGRLATFVDPLADRWFVGRPDLIGADGVHPNVGGMRTWRTRLRR